ncbi:hypothetical protein L7F22_011354 [Adiantum nelumboides]|nr:hypothetical protein [Adiantum nelumboides]
MVAARIDFQQGAKRNPKPMEAKDKQEYKGKNSSQKAKDWRFIRLDSERSTAVVEVAALSRQVADAKIKIVQLETEIQARGGSAIRGITPKDPEAYDGTREVKVFHASTFLSKHTKLWWTNYVDDVANGRNTFTISTWDEMKAALQKQFLPMNAEWKARQSLDDLKQTGSIRDYMKAFQALMLQIRTMSEDRFFHFTHRLKGCAQADLRRQNITTLAAAYVAANRLTDYQGKWSAGRGFLSG